MADHLNEEPHRGPLGMDPSLVTVESARFLAEAVQLPIKPPRERAAGRRPAHRVGLFLSGHFTPTAEARALSHSRIFREHDVPLLARLSPMGLSGLDGKRDLHGFAVKFHYNTDRATSDLVALTMRRFMFRDGDAFAGLAWALVNGTLRQKLGASAGFVTLAAGGRASYGGMWDTIRVVGKAPANLTNLTYYDVNTYFAEDPAGHRTPYRYSIRPKPVVQAGSSDQTIGQLYRTLCDAVRVGTTLEYELVFELPWKPSAMKPWLEVPAAVRDRLLDSTRPWRNSHPVAMGTIRLMTIEDDLAFADNAGQTEARFDDLLFDPTNLAHGLYPSEDRILRARGGSYTESHIRGRGNHATP